MVPAGSVSVLRSRTVRAIALARSCRPRTASPSWGEDAVLGLKPPEELGGEAPVPLPGDEIEEGLPLHGQSLPEGELLPPTPPAEFQQAVAEHAHLVVGDLGHGRCRGDFFLKPAKHAGGHVPGRTPPLGAGRSSDQVRLVPRPPRPREVPDGG